MTSPAASAGCGTSSRRTATTLRRLRQRPRVEPQGRLRGQGLAGRADGHRRGAAGHRVAHRLDRAPRRHHPQLQRRPHLRAAVDRLRPRPARGQPSLHLRLRTGGGPGRALRGGHDRASARCSSAGSRSSACSSRRRSATCGWWPLPGSSASSATSWWPSTASAWATRSAHRRSSPTGCTHAPTGSPRSPWSSRPSACGSASRWPTRSSA